MDYPWAVPGAKVVCIVTRPAWTSAARSGLGAPQIGNTYTVREVVILNGIPRLRFVEIVNPITEWKDHPEPAEAMFSVKCFRPLITQSDDVAKFTHLLTPQKIEEPA